MLETGAYTQTANPPRIALSPDAEVLAVSVDSAIEFYDTYTGKLYDTIENVYIGEYWALLHNNETNSYLSNTGIVCKRLELISAF